MADENISDQLDKKSVPIFEQETHISYMRDESSAKIYTSDSTQITRLDKLCKESPDMYVRLGETQNGKSYLLKDKSLVSLRKSKRQMTDEQKRLAAERMKKWQQDKNLDVNNS